MSGSELQPKGSANLSQLLQPQEIAELWILFTAIHKLWGESETRVEDMASRWREFIGVKCQGGQSYLDTYRSGCLVLQQLSERYGASCHEYVLLDPDVIAEAKSNPALPISQLRRMIIEEFIRVYVASGGFRSYGGENYGGFVSGSRYRQNPPYRVAEGA